MRALAHRLGVHPNTLYSHITSKGELEEALLDGLLADVRTRDDHRTDWRTSLHDVLHSTYDILVAHPDLVPLYQGRGSRGENAQRLGEIMLDLMRRGGVDGPSAQQARLVLIVYTIGFAAFATRPGFEQEDAELRRARMTDNFNCGVRWLIKGIAP